MLFESYGVAGKGEARSAELREFPAGPWSRPHALLPLRLPTSSSSPSSHVYLLRDRVQGAPCSLSAPGTASPARSPSRRARSQSFVDVPVSADGVDTLQFLEATEGLIKMFGASSAFATGASSGQAEERGELTRLLACGGGRPSRADLLGSTAFTIVQNDMNGNVTVRAFPSSVEERRVLG